MHEEREDGNEETASRCEQSKSNGLGVALIFFMKAMAHVC